MVRDDSDDELGLEDHPWEWIHSPTEGRDGRPPILGARMGNFQCAVGDGVLLKAEDANEAWIGLICEFLEDEEDGEKTANFMWFSTEREIRNKEKKRTDFLPVSCSGMKNIRRLLIDRTKSISHPLGTSTL